MSTPSYRSDFRVAIICALPEEKEAVVAVMDRMYSEEDIYIPGHVNDTNTYTYGQLGGQPVALCTLQDAGTRTAAQAIAKMEVSFLKLTIIFVVGIAGGAPFDREGTSTGIRLGDVVVSNAIYQHDLAKQNEDGVEIITDNDRQLPQLRGKAAAWIKHLSPKDIARIAKNTNIDFVLYGDLLAEKYTQPALDTDRIYDRTRRHKHRSGCSLCAQATETTGTVCSTVHNEACSAINCKPEPMPPRTRTGTEIFIGPYVSGSQVIKSAQHRAKLVELFGALALEMEGAGSCGEYPILIVKGIVDYADSHKNKRWRLYPAAMAALCTRAIIQDMQLGSEFSAQKSTTKLVDEGDAHFRLGQYDRALTDYSSAYREAYKDNDAVTMTKALKSRADCHRMLGGEIGGAEGNSKLTAMGELKTAIILYERWMQLTGSSLDDGESRETAFNLAKCFELLEEWSRALELYESLFHVLQSSLEAYAITGENIVGTRMDIVLARHGMAMAISGLGRPDLAVNYSAENLKDLELLTSQGPWASMQRYKTMLQLARDHFEAGDDVAAKSWASECVTPKIRPENPAEQRDLANIKTWATHILKQIEESESDTALLPEGSPQT